MLTLLAAALLLAGPAAAPAAGCAPAPPLTPPPVEVHRLEVSPGDTVVATEQGTGAVVVLVPGLLGHAFGFRHIAPALADAGYRTVIVEPLGTGNSGTRRNADYTLEAQAQRVGSVLDQLGIDRAHLVCYSVGASICLRLALQQPAAVRSITSINGGPDEHAATGGLKSALRWAPLIKLFGAGGRLRGKLVEGLRRNSADPSWVTDEVVAEYTAPFRDLGRTLNTLKAMARAVEPDSLRPRLPQVTQPVQLLLGLDAPAGAPRPEDVELMARALPRFRADTIPAAGQYLHEEQPAAVVAAIVRFVEAHR